MLTGVRIYKCCATRPKPVASPKRYYSQWYLKQLRGQEEQEMMHYPHLALTRNWQVQPMLSPFLNQAWNLQRVQIINSSWTFSSYHATTFSITFLRKGRWEIWWKLSRQWDLIIIFEKGETRTFLKGPGNVPSSRDMLISVWIHLESTVLEAFTSIEDLIHFISQTGSNCFQITG